MVVSAKRFEVTANLESALRHLGKTDESRKLWIDAIYTDRNKHGSHILTSRSCPYNGKKLPPAVGTGQKRFLLHLMPVLLEIGDVVCITPSLRSPWYYGKYCLATEAPSEAKY